MGRASGSCRDTTRVEPSGTVPDSRVRVWAAICSTSAAVRSRSATTALALALAPSPARRRDRLALAATWRASATAASAMAAISAVMAFTSSLASSLRLRSQAPMSWARRRTERVRLRLVVLAARPMALSLATPAAILATPLASRPLSVG
jgi:hypothetical protein